ncbi:MAG TPA: choice-of-anchor M domain-containing protein [Verrucomicrobiota bacterium]|nr:choice-of-anchor M domain-containing protein [Verrucomicrobiota bacterium]HNU50405.1 choice-of-anchor M domain-containing protein [Verrucomicrobiota bacterium]
MPSCRPLLAAALLTLAPPSATAQCHHFTREHVDLLSIRWNASEAALSLMASDDDHGGTLYASNQCVVVCPESMKFILPDGTPFGSAGDPLWILPQSPYAGTPYIGVSAETIASGSFHDPMTITLKHLDGPGHFILWQATGLGSLEIRMDTRDGITDLDTITPGVGAHEHYNWGFTTSGVYRLTFQAGGRRLGHTTNTLSPETPFTFHILPLRPFEVWTATNWPCECNLKVIGTAADPDGDLAPNAFEYGVGSNPRQPDSPSQLTVSLVTTQGATHSLLSFAHPLSATDAVCEVVASPSLSPPQWTLLTNTIATTVTGDLRHVTLQDPARVDQSQRSFYQLRVRLE